MAKRLEKPKSSNLPYLIGLLIGLILLVIIAIQNSDTVDLELLLWHFEGNLALFLTLFFALGFIIGLFTALINLFKKDRRITKQAKEIQKLQQELGEQREDSKE